MIVDHDVRLLEQLRQLEPHKPSSAHAELLRARCRAALTRRVEQGAVSWRHNLTKRAVEATLAAAMAGYLIDMIREVVRLHTR